MGVVRRGALGIAIVTSVGPARVTVKGTAIARP